MKGKIITSYVDRNTTKMVIEAREPLVAGRNVYVGPKSIPVTVDDLLSRSKGLYYYSAKAAGKVEIEKGAEIRTQPTRELKTPSILSLTIKETYTFEQKRRAEITAVQGNRAMIDRGTLHEVRERDLYRIYDSSGRYKGLLEVRGIGDLQSSGILYNALEDFRRGSLSTQPGDRAIFRGQRKLFGLGLVGGIRGRRDFIFNGREENFGVGLIWNVTFRDGWGAEIFFGGFARDGEGHNNFPIPPWEYHFESNTRRALFIAPIWLKKNFFYPFVVSPFLGAGLSLFVGKNDYRVLAPDIDINEKKKVTTVVPVLGAGIELFPARFFRPRFDVRWFGGPKIEAAGNTYDTKSVFYSFGFLTTW